MEIQSDQAFSPERNGKRALTPVYVPQPSPPDPDELDLRQLLGLIRRRAILIAGVAIAVSSTIWIWTLQQTPVYEGKFQLLVEPVTADGELSKLTQLAQGENAASPRLDYATQIQVLKSPELMRPIVKQIQAKDSSINYGMLVNQLTIARLQETKILEVRYRDSDPAKIKAVLELVARSYLKYSLDERQTNLRQGIQFVEDQLSTLRDRVNDLQSDLQNFRQKYNFIDPENQAQQISQQVNTLSQQRLDTQKELAETQQQYVNLQGELGAAAALSSAPLYQDLLGQLREVESNIAVEAARFREASPKMQTLQEQRQNLVPLLRQEARRVLGDKLAEVASQIEVLSVRSQAIAQAEARLNQQLQDLPALSRQYNDLQRELKVATESLNRFLATRETLQVDAAQKEVPWQIISYPEKPSIPVSPNVNRNLLLGAIAGLLLGIGAAMIAEKLDNTFHSPEDLKYQTKLPLLGLVPFSKHLKSATVEAPQPAGLGLIFGYQNRIGQYVISNFLEAFRSLYANIRLLSSDTRIRSLVVSSAIPGDGKSTVSLHLAQAAAAMGQRVLLVDADMRRPQVSKALGLPNMRGLSNLIASDIDFTQVIQRPPQDPDALPLGDNLFVLTSGQIPPDPTKLLSSQKMHRLMEQFQAMFDLVIYDTPPLLGLADSSLLATHTDGLILVVGLGRTDRAAFMQALESLKLSQTPTLGIVANGIDSSSAIAYSYYHKYYSQSHRKSLPSDEMLQEESPN